MTIHFIPVIKVFDVGTISIPQKVTVTLKMDGKLWWKHTNTIPSIIQNTNDIKIHETGIVDRMTAYRFSQCIINLLIYNRLMLDKPQKFIFTVENNMNTFIYFIDEDEVITIPILPPHKQILKFTLFENKYPILKLQIQN